jgi:lactate permease
VLCAIFVYDITVKTGKFEQVRHTIAGLAVDRRIQLLLIAFSFGAFIEGRPDSARRSRSARRC